MILEKKMAIEKKSEEKDEIVLSKSVDTIIFNHVGFAMIAGAIPVPLVDIIAVTAIQVEMLRNIAEHFNVDFNKDRVKSIISALVGASISKAGASTLKMIPGLNILGTGAQVILSGATTYALGKLFEDHFQRNGDFINVNIDEMKSQFQDLLKKGKEIAEKTKKKQSKDDIFATISRLKDLKDSGAITDEEFEKTKASLLKKIK